MYCIKMGLDHKEIYNIQQRKTSKRNSCWIGYYKSKMTLNFQMIVERYLNHTKWLAVWFPAMGLSLSLTKNYLGGQAFHVFRKTKKKTKQKNRIGYYRIPYLKLYSCNATKLNASLSYALASFFILNTLLPL